MENDKKPIEGEVVEEPKALVKKEDNPLIDPTQDLESFKSGVDNLLAKRDYFKDQVLPKLKEKQDYHVIKGKKSLAKGGAEKLASIYGFTARFIKDTKTKEMMKDMAGLVCYKCLLKKNGVTVGEGRGAAMLKKNDNDPNKTIKMAQKSAHIDAVIRTTGLSDIFTQDLEDMDRNSITDNYNNSKDDKPWFNEPDFERESVHWGPGMTAENIIKSVSAGYKVSGKMRQAIIDFMGSFQ